MSSSSPLHFPHQLNPIRRARSPSSPSSSTSSLSTPLPPEPHHPLRTVEPSSLEEQMLTGETRLNPNLDHDAFKIVKVDKEERERRMEFPGGEEEKMVEEEEKNDTLGLGTSVVSAGTGSGTGSGERPKLDMRTSSQRFKSAVKKVQNVKRVLKYENVEDESHSREPGVDPKRVDMPDLKQKVVVQVVDYCRTQAQFSVLMNEDVQGFLERPRASWAKRWIHVNGLSWDVIKPIALKYNLHPLSLEDMLHHGTSSTRSKADYYRQHLFVSVVVHKTFATDAEDDLSLALPPKTGTSSPSSTEAPVATAPSSLWEQVGFKKFSSPSEQEDEESKIESKPPVEDQEDDDETAHESMAPSSHSMNHERYNEALFEAFSKIKREPLDEEERDLSHMATSTGFARTFRKPKHRKTPDAKKNWALHSAARHTVSRLTKDIRVHIHIEQLSIFLLRDGTVISFTQDPGYHGRFSKIFDRIHSQGDIIRDSEDSSFVLQALLDNVADHALEIVDEFRDQITKLESRVLASPDMGDVRHLHILSAQLLLLKSTLTPFQHLLQAIKTQDDAKAASLILDAPGKPGVGGGKGSGSGFVSHEAKVYLGDVMDHVESVLSSLDLFSSLAENLIAYTFNDLSYSSNSYMQALSVLSVIFLPLTFISGYFGMNFATFPAALNGDVTLFWKISVPILVFLVFVFSWTYLVRMVLTVRRETLRMYHQYSYKRKAQ